MPSGQRLLKSQRKILSPCWGIRFLHIVGTNLLSKSQTGRLLTRTEEASSVNLSWDTDQRWGSFLWCSLVPAGKCQDSASRPQLLPLPSLCNTLFIVISFDTINSQSLKACNKLQTNPPISVIAQNLTPRILNAVKTSNLRQMISFNENHKSITFVRNLSWVKIKCGVTPT
jgi:hypothetical protein